MDADNEFNALMQQVLEGSDVAATELFRRYERAILRAIRKGLHPKVRSRFDSVDIAQDVWKSFFAIGPVERTFETPTELLAFLTRLARHKVIDVVRRRTISQKDNVARERSINDPGNTEAERLIDTHQATPSQILMSEEEWRRFLADQPPAYRAIFQMLHDGNTQEQVAAKLGVSTRQIRRVIRAGGLGATS